MSPQSSQHWRQVLEDIWGLRGSISQLDGEFDLNFLLQTNHKAYIFKVMRADCDEALVDMQCCAFAHLNQISPSLPMPKVINTLANQPYIQTKDEAGCNRLVWLLQALPGTTYAHFTPKSLPLIGQLGHYLGHMDKQLESFAHPYLERDFKWNLMQADWVHEQLHCIKDESKRTLLKSISMAFIAVKPQLDALPQVALHNDVNDYNILAQGNYYASAAITGIIDLGDMCRGAKVCELAICGAYIVLDQADPSAALCQLVSSYHQQHLLSQKELKLIWPLLLMRLVVSIVNSTQMAATKPHDPYITISQASAWDFLLNNSISGDLLTLELLVACDYPVNDTSVRLKHWLAHHQGDFFPLLGLKVNLNSAPMIPLSVEHSAIPENPISLDAEEAISLSHGSDSAISLGYYNEPRLIYTEQAFKTDQTPISRRRTVHLGIDIFAAAGQDLHAPMDAYVEAIEPCPGYLDYGAIVILRHQIDDQHVFYSLYGHLQANALDHLKVGQKLQRGSIFAQLGEPSHNGGWDPHVHVQIATSLLGIGYDWPGAADPDQLPFWQQVHPNPAAWLNLDPQKACYQGPNHNQLLAYRQQHFAANLTLTYDQPIMFLRGWQHYLFDESGRPYLDAYNNVPHVGHAHPRIQQVAAQQLRQINTNSRYLHPSRGQLAKSLLTHCPDSLQVCYLVNSGSEANELALRLARAHTGAKHMITSDHGYHGNTTGAIDISAYKFNAPGGSGQSDWVHLVDLADTYRGPYRLSEDTTHADCAQQYATQIEKTIAQLQRQDEALAGFIAETFPSVGGQIIPPQGYLQQVYKNVRDAGGVCIADEVQTALGRLGDYYFAFEQQQVVPDIVVLGKPIGNGQPIGIVVTTQAIADSFAQGPEFFSTFGGSNLSCVIANEVLQIVEDEQLMNNAKIMGEHLIAGLQWLQKKHNSIGDVRGCGLFIGVDLVTDRHTREPATKLTTYIKNRMRQERILMGSEGPNDNILKIRPPLTIGQSDVDYLLHILDAVLSEAKHIATDNDEC